MSNLDIKKYSTVVEAVQFTDASLAWDIAEWCEGYTNKLGDFDTVCYPPEFYDCKVGDWLIKVADWDFVSVPSADFEKLYVEHVDG